MSGSAWQPRVGQAARPVRRREVHVIAKIVEGTTPPEHSPPQPLLPWPLSRLACDPTHDYGMLWLGDEARTSLGETLPLYPTCWPTGEGETA